jgi:hypothetical protein
MDIHLLFIDKAKKKYILAVFELKSLEISERMSLGTPKSARI